MTEVYGDNLEHEPEGWGDALAWGLDVCRWPIAVIKAALAIIAISCLLLTISVADDYRPARKPTDTRPRVNDGAQVQKEFRAERSSQDAKVEPAAIEESAEPAPDVLTPEAMPESDLPPADESTEGTGSQGVRAAMKAPVDSRPVVVVDTLHDGLLNSDPRHRVLCNPCDGFFDFHATYHDVFPLRFDVRRGANVNELSNYALSNGTPVFRFQGQEGGWYVSKGWTGPEKLLSDFRARNPLHQNAPPMAMFAVPRGSQATSIVQMFGKFAGPGQFSYSPTKPVAAYIDDATFLQYTQLKATIRNAANGIPVMEFADPKPQVSKRIAFIWGNGTVNWISLDGSGPVPMLNVGTNRGKYSIEVKELK